VRGDALRRCAAVRIARQKRDVTAAAQRRAQVRSAWLLVRGGAEQRARTPTPLITITTVSIRRCHATIAAAMPPSFRYCRPPFIFARRHYDIFFRQRRACARECAWRSVRYARAPKRQRKRRDGTHKRKRAAK